MAITETIYIESATSLQERLARIDAIILALENQMINYGAGSADIEEYNLDDGQVRIKTIYRSVDKIALAISNYESIRERILNKLNGRVFAGKSTEGLR